MSVAIAADRKSRSCYKSWKAFDGGKNEDGNVVDARCVLERDDV